MTGYLVNMASELDAAVQDVLSVTKPIRDVNKCTNALLTAHSASIASRRIPPQNIVQRLIFRELHAGRRHSCSAGAMARKFFTNVFPNYTVINVEKPACFLRKFSPDGRYLIAFSADQTSLEIYEFCGPAAAADMLNALPTNDGASDFLPDSVDIPAATQVRTQLFSRFFKQIRVTGIAVNGECLNRECSLFTNDGRSVSQLEIVIRLLTFLTLQMT